MVDIVSKDDHVRLGRKPVIFVARMSPKCLTSFQHSADFVEFNINTPMRTQVYIYIRYIVCYNEKLATANRLCAASYNSPSGQIGQQNNAHIGHLTSAFYCTLNTHNCIVSDHYK